MEQSQNEKIHKTKSQNKIAKGRYTSVQLGLQFEM